MSNERAYLRDIKKKEKESADEMDSRTLLQAVDSFVLSGAVKLFRAGRGVSIKLRHHTMLVHRSTARDAHLADQLLVKAVFDLARYDSREAAKRLKKLWESDFYPVSLAKSGGLPTPEKFEELIPYIDQALTRIRNYGGSVGPVRVVNAEPGLAEQVPDFDREDVWSILVGGAKLSRGFTVEGLTVSYFRRPTKTADTLMQTGRWFGFRQGYHDAVRVFFGREEPAGRNATYDLQEAFKSICMDEEVFRGQLRRYVERRDGIPPITPKQIPPLVPMHLLQPTATNKMYNAKVEFLNFGGEWKESTPQPADGDLVAKNAEIFGDLLKTLHFEKVELGVTDPDDSSESIRWKGLVAEAEPAAILGVLDKLRWVKDLEGYADERRFMASSGDLSPGIDRWLIIAPQQDVAAPIWQCGQSFKIVERATRNDSKGNLRYGVYSERRHRIVAGAIAGVKQCTGLTPDTQRLCAPRTAVLMFYPTVHRGTGKKAGPRGAEVRIADDKVTMGFGLQFPKNEIKRLVVFGVRNKNRPEAVVITEDQGA